MAAKRVRLSGLAAASAALLLLMASAESLAQTSGSVRAVWMYGFSSFDNTLVTQNLNAMGINRVFLSTNSLSLESDAAYRTKMLDLLAQAHAAGIEIHAMTLEDPNFTYDHASAQVHFGRFLDFCEANPSSCFDGIHIDVEPHDVTNWSAWRDAADDAAKNLIMESYVQLLATLRTQLDERPAVSLPFSAAIAWWWNENAVSGSLPAAAAGNLAAHLDYLVPMAYRENADRIHAGAADEVAIAPTLVGINVPDLDLPDYASVLATSAELDARFAGQPNYLGIATFRYTTLRDAWLESVSVPASDPAGLALLALGLALVGALAARVRPAPAISARGSL